VTVIAGQPKSEGARAAKINSGQVILVDAAASGGNGTWALWDGKRSRIDLADHAVTNALGLGNDVPAPRPIASGLFNAIPEAPPLTAPLIPNAGSPAGFAVPAPIGGVVVSYAVDRSASDAISYYAVLPDGLQPISPVLASILRNTNSYGLQQPPRLGADEIAKLPVSRLLDTSGYPAQPVTAINAASNPVTCAFWSKPTGAATSSLSLLSGSALPVPEGLRTVDLVGGGAKVALVPGIGYFAQTVGGGAAAPATGSLFWISDTGVRYGIDNEADGRSGSSGPGKAVEALGLRSPPLGIPWSILSLFAPGPTLSRTDALLAHDGLPPDSRPGRPVSAEGEPR
jgi:type VII secretion protein EccB